MRQMQTAAPLVALVLFVHPSFAQTLPLPPRSADAPSRDEIIATITPLSRESREDVLFRQIMDGNIPDFMRTLVPVTSSASIGGTLYSVTYYVTPDYFAVGSEERYFLAPMTPLLAQRIADSLHCTLPTRKMVNDIYAAAPLKLAPAPIPPSAAMITVPVFAQHDSMVWTQREPQLSAFPLGSLVGGTKKDVVISNKIRNDLRTGVPKPVVIYGWHQLNGVPIQPLYNGHGETYADYSHGIRMVQESVSLDGSPTTISAILKDQTLAPILSDEGQISVPRYGDPVTGVREDRGTAPQGSGIFQNVPNPFNPNTIIRYRLSMDNYVSLNVYDLLGREVAVLVNEEKPPGSYEVAFDATGLSSGVYLYRLTAGSFVQSRKMILLR
jgi:Secretion system C-terminal sorting domain